MRNDIEQAIKYFTEEFKYGFEDEIDDFEFNETEGTLTFGFPNTEEAMEFNIDEMFEYVKECKSMHVQPQEGVVTTKKRYFQLVKEADEITFAVIYFNHVIKVTYLEDISISLTNKHFLIGCAALKTNSYQEDYQDPLSYTAVEILYKDQNKRLDNDQSSKLVDSFLFELADSHELNFNKIMFFKYDDSENEAVFNIKNKEFLLKPLENYNDGMRLYNAALQVADPELKLLSLYKVFEYFTPIVFSLEVNEALRKKLDSRKALSPDGNFLKSIFELSLGFDSRKNDKQLMRSLFSTCLDMVELTPLLPISLRRAVEYNAKKNILESYAQDIAETLVATRNQVAHAKSNYELTGKECPTKDIVEFNKFLKAAAAGVIRWYNRLPEHQKLTPKY